MIWTNHVFSFKQKFYFYFVIASVLTSIQGHVLEFVVEPSDTVVESGRSAVLDCVIKASPDYPHILQTIQWLDQDRQPLTFIGDNYRSQLTNGSLYISSVVEDQGLTGNYQCMASLPTLGSIVSRTARLSLANLSGFHLEPRDLTVFVGQKAYFACSVQASPAPKIRWFKDERPLQLDELRMTVLPSGALEIDEVLEIDQGFYRCNASGLNSYRLSNKANLIVIDNLEQAASPLAPTFIAVPQNKIVTEGQSVTLDCAANGNPPPVIKWLKDGYSIDMADLDSRFSSVESTTSLHIKNIQESDGGTYHCRAENREDSSDAHATIEVQVPPRFLEKPEDKIDIINKDIELACSVYGNPEPKVMWLKNGEIINLNEYYQLVNGYNLKILGLMTSDTGLFQCVASNPAGNVQASASLKVLSLVEDTDGEAAEGLPGAPQDVKASIVKARFVTLSWQPPVFTNGDISVYSVYYRQEGSERERVQNTSHSHLEDINIGGLQPGRVYFFRVVAYNSVGAGTTSKSLRVITQSEEHVPSAPLDVNAYAVSSQSIHVNWKPPINTNGEIQRYNVYYMETSSSTEHHLETTKLECDLHSLSIFTEYYIWVVAVNRNGPGTATEEKYVRTFSAAPSQPPYNVTLEPASSTSIFVRWEPPPPEGQNGLITGYKLKFRKVGKKGDIITTPGNLRIHLLNNLDRASRYQVKLWATNVNGTGPATEWHETETYESDLDESRVPERPSPLRVRPTADKIYVLWNPPLEQTIKIRNYVIGWGKGIPDNHTEILDEKQRSFIIEGVEPNSEYVISLCAHNDVGAGELVYYNVRTREDLPPEPLTPLPPPMGLKAHVTSATSVVLYWIDNTLGKTQDVRDSRYYTVKCTDEKISRSRYLNVTRLYAEFSDLKSNTLYEFTVKLVKGKRESPWSMVVLNSTWPLAPSSAPKEVHVVPVDETGNVELKWQAPKTQSSNINGYIILYTTNTSITDREWTPKGVKGEKVTSCVIENLEPFTTYYFKVQARNNKSNGPFSQIVSYRTGANIGSASADAKLAKDGRSTFSGPTLLYLIIGACVLTLITISLVLIVLCCRRRDATASPQTAKKGYQKGHQQIKPPDLWIHHDQMELKALEKSHLANDGASSSGAMTLPRSVGANEYDSHDGHHSNSLDKRTYVPNYMGISPDDKNVRPVKTKSISLRVEAKPSKEPIATATPINTSLSQTSSDSTPSSRPPYPRTQYSISRAHVTIDPSNMGNTQLTENPYVSHVVHNGYDTGSSSTGYTSHQPPPAAHLPPSSNYAPGLSVLAESQGGKRIQAQGHPLKSFSVPAPPPISAPGTPQSKHIVSSQPQVTIRPTSSPYKKLPLNTSMGTPPSRISASNPPPHLIEEVQPLQPSHSTEELNQEMANLEGLMLTLNAITANEFEC